MNHGLLLRFQAKAVYDVYITECTSNVRIKICSDKILSWDCHAGTDAKIIAEKLCWAGSLSGMEDVDYWSCKLHSNLKMGVLLGRKAGVFLKDATVQFLAKQNWHQKLWETSRKKSAPFKLRLCLRAMRSLRSWAEMKDITMSTGRSAKLWWHI